MRPRAKKRDRTETAFTAYLDLADTAADWGREFERQLQVCSLTTNEFRLLLLLYWNGPMSVSRAAEARNCGVHNILPTIKGMAAQGFLQRQLVRRAPVEMRASKVPKARRQQPRIGRKIWVLSLTLKGEERLEDALWLQTKRAKARMRILTMRQQKTLSALCRKLREPSWGAAWRFLREMRMKDTDEELLLMSRAEREAMRGLSVGECVT